MLSIYPASFFEEEENHYSVIFPDFNYLSTCGDSLQDAMEMAVDCLAGALFSAKLDNEDIPIPSKLEEMDPTQIASELEFEFKQSFVTLVSVDVEEYAKTHFNKAIKKTVDHDKVAKELRFAYRSCLLSRLSCSTKLQLIFLFNQRELTKTIQILILLIYWQLHKIFPFYFLINLLSFLYFVNTPFGF